MKKSRNGHNRIETLRRRIDGVDDELLRLLYSRANLAIAVGQMKQKTGVPTYSPARERAILERMAKVNGGPLQETAVKRIFREIVRESRRAALRERSK